MKTLYLCGAGNSEGVRLALAVNRAQNRWDRILLLDDNPARHGQSLLGVDIAGPFALLHEADPNASEVANLVARTSPKRRSARRKIEGYGLPFAPLISPSVDTLGVEFAPDVIVYQNAVLGPEVFLDDGSVIFMGAMVGHESRVGPGCVLAPCAVINARVELGEGVYIGTHATVLPEVKIGAWATIGAGSVATRDVPAGATLIGVPGKIVLTANLKLDMGEFEAVPHALRQELEREVR